MNIGEFIEELSKYKGDEVLVQVSDVGGSYRGFYESFYIKKVTEDGNSSGITVRELLVSLKYEVVGGCYEGYKGGGYIMDDYTDLYLASYGGTGGLVEGITRNTRGELELILNYDYI